MLPRNLLKKKKSDLSKTKVSMESTGAKKNKH